MDRGMVDTSSALTVEVPMLNKLSDMINANRVAVILRFK